MEEADRIDFQIRPGIVDVLRARSAVPAGTRVLWANAICTAFLLIGIVGVKDPRPPVPVVVRQDPVSVVPVEFVPLEPEPSASSAEAAGPEVKSEGVTEEVPQPVLAEVSAAEVTLAKPVGDVPMPQWNPHESVGLPVRTAGAIAVSDAVGSGVVGLGTTGESALVPRAFRAGEGAKDGVVAPAPEYPVEARRRGVEGRVKLEMDVDGDGGVATVRMLVSSGSYLLDNHTVGWVKRRWKFPVGRRQLLHTEFVYRLTDGR